MRIPKGHGFDLAGGTNLIVVLRNNQSLQGTFLGVVEERKYENLPPKINIGGKFDCDEGTEFLLLQLTCAFSEFFPVGSIVAINVDNISIIGPGNFLCAPSPA